MPKAVWISMFGATFIAATALADAPPAGGAPASATPAPAAHQAAQKGKYGVAGCGLGSMIISSGGIVQIFAATTNGTSANQTFAISSGTSNCDDSGSGDDSARVFVEANRVALAKDISRGTGETIDGLATIAGCADAKAVGGTLQRNFKAIFPSASVSSERVTDSILSTLKGDAALACTAIGS
ncbi:MAG: DUF3015 family protein [Polyangiaceae bacterium]